MAASLARVVGAATPLVNGLASNVTLAVAIPAEALPGRLAVLTVSQERQAAGLTVQAVEGSTPWVVERNATSGTAQTVVNAWKYLTAADIAAGQVRVNVTATRRVAMSLAVVVGGGVPTFTHAAYAAATGTVNTIVHPAVTAPAGSLILDVAAVTSRAAQPLFPSTVESPTDTWLRSFTPGAGWTFATGAVQGTAQEGTVNAYAYTAHRTQATAGTVAAHIVTVDRSSNGSYATRVVIPPATAGPVVTAGDPAEVESWGTGTLAGTAADPSSTVTGHTWRLISSSPAGLTVTLDPEGPTATYAAPGTLTRSTLTFGYRATNAEGVQSAEATVTHTVLPATEAWIHPQQGLRPLQQVTMADFTPVPVTPDESDNEQPTASFSFTVDGLTVHVDATSSGDPEGGLAGLVWEWGDGQSTTMDAGYLTSHDYATAGVYPVTLTVYDQPGASGAVIHTVTVGAVDRTAPTAPTDLRQVTVTPDGYTIAWGASTDATGVTGYRVLETINGGAEQLRTTTAAGTRTWTATGRTPGTTHTVAVVAVDAAGNTSPRATLTITTTTTSSLAQYGDLLADWDGAQLTASPVESWLPGEGRAQVVLSQATAANRPTWGLTGGNYLVTFDGTDYLQATDVPMGNAVDGLTVHGIVQMAPTVTGIRQVLFLTRGGAGTGRFAATIVDGKPRLSGRRLDTDSSAILDGVTDIRGTAPRVVTWVRDYAGATAQLYVDGVLDTSGPLGTQGLTSATDAQSLTFGAGSGGNEGFIGGLSRVAVLEHAQTPEQVAATVAAIRANIVTDDGGPVDEPGGPAPVTEVDAYVLEARQAYPDGIGQWAHMPPWWLWPEAWWVPQTPEGDAYTSPDGKPVIRGRRPRGDSAAVLAITGSTGPGRSCLILRCPVQFKDLGQDVEHDLFRGLIVQGQEFTNTAWLEQPVPEPIYNTAADADARRNPVPMRRGRAYYNPAETGSAGALDGPDRKHNRSIYIRPSGGGTEKVFYATEGSWCRGPWVPEGINVNGTENAMVSIAAHRHDWVSVYFKKSDTNIAAGTAGGIDVKVPGGDLIQVFNRLKDFQAIGVSGVTHYQAMFQQHGGQQLVRIHKFNSRGDEDPAYGGTSGYQTRLGPRHDYVDWDLEDVYVYRANGAGTRADGDLYPEIVQRDVPDYVTPAHRIGTRYALNPTPKPGA